MFSGIYNPAALSISISRCASYLCAVGDFKSPSLCWQITNLPERTLLYARIVRQQHNEPVAPALLFIQHAAADDYDPILCFGSERIADVATPEGDRFVKLLMEKVEEIFNPEQPFIPTADQDRCRTCPYAQLCGL